MKGHGDPARVVARHPSCLSAAVSPHGAQDDADEARQQPEMVRGRTRGRC